MQRSLLLALVGSLAASATQAQTSLNLGASLTQGNSESTVVNIGASNTQTNGLHQIAFKADYNYGEAVPKGASDSEKNTENASAGAKYRNLFSDPVYAYVNGDILTDDIAGIDYRLTVGPGLGTLLRKDAVVEQSLEAGLAYVKEELTGESTADDGTVTEVKTEDDRITLRVAHGYKRDISATARVFQGIEWLPTIDDFGQFLLNAELGVESMMNDRLSLRVVAKNSHNSEPAEGKDENDLSVIAGIGYKL
jgi:putative salt-induced outer membrane protein YdiY